MGHPRGGRNSKRPAGWNRAGNPLILLLPAGQGSAYRGAAPVRPVRPDAEGLSAAKGEASDRGRTALAQRALTPWTPRRATRKQPLSSEAALFKQRNRIERRFDRLKDWRRRATRSDRRAHTFFSARCLAATLLCWV